MKEGLGDLPALAAAFAKGVPREVLAPLLEGLSKLSDGSSAEQVASLGVTFCQPHLRHEFSLVVQAWARQDPRPAPIQLAWLLLGAIAMEAAFTDREQIELVWTGPPGEGPPKRRTDQVLLDLINGAEKELLIISYAAYKIPILVKAISEALARGVRVLFVLEGMDSGTLRFDGLPALGKNLAEKAEFYAWPADKRPQDEKGNRGALHAKCAVADRQILLVTSANLTEAAMGRNMELGLHIAKGETPQRIWGHFSVLIRDGVLVRIRPNQSA